MSKRSPKSVEEKLEIIQLALSHEKSVEQLSRYYQVDSSTINRWLTRYQKYGVTALKESRTWKNYSYELKHQAVQDYLSGKGSLRDICLRYDISSNEVLRKWVKRYTSGEDLKATSKGYSHMRQGRQTTFDERVEIVTFTIAHNKDYQAAIEKYGISYQQVYSWVRKFEQEGSQGLLDRRGKGLETKPNLTPEEKLQLKIKQLEERNQYLEMELGLLKKLDDINRGNRR